MANYQGWGQGCQAEGPSHHQGLASWWYRGSYRFQDLTRAQGQGHPAGKELGGRDGWAFNVLLCTVPAATSLLGQALPPPAFADLSDGPLLLEPCRPSYSSTSSRKPSEPPRTGLQCPQTRPSSDDQVALT